MDQKLTEPREVGFHGKSAAADKERWRSRALREIKRFLAMFFYIWVIYGLFLLHEAVVLARYDIPFTRWGVGLASALVLAKVKLVMDDFNIARGFAGKPLIFSIAYRSVVYAIVFIAFYTAEETVSGLVRGRALADSIPSIGGGTPQGIALALVIVSLALVPYFGYRAVAEAVGPGRLRALLFASPETRAT